jgi:hypothetical protein
MTPSTQAALSLKYVQAPFVIVPTADGIALFSCNGCERFFVATFESDTELVAHLRSDFAVSLERVDREAQVSAVAATRIADLDFDTDTLFNLDLEIEL